MQGHYIDFRELLVLESITKVPLLGVLRGRSRRKLCTKHTIVIYVLQLNGIVITKESCLRVQDFNAKKVFQYGFLVLCQSLSEEYYTDAGF